MKVNKSLSLKRGFSLVEMLVVIAVIGIIAAIAVPNIGKINDAAKDATNRRNAQSIASIYASAQAAGLDLSDGTDVKKTIAKVVTGGKVTDEGPFKDSFFGVPSMSTADQTAAAPYLKFGTSGMLEYIGVQNK